jgi:hypothetical protein
LRRSPPSARNRRSTRSRPLAASHRSIESPWATAVRRARRFGLPPEGLRPDDHLWDGQHLTGPTESAPQPLAHVRPRGRALRDLDPVPRAVVRIRDRSGKTAHLRAVLRAKARPPGIASTLRDRREREDSPQPVRAPASRGLTRPGRAEREPALREREREHEREESAPHDRTVAQADRLREGLRARSRSTERDRASNPRQAQGRAVRDSSRPELVSSPVVAALRDRQDPGCDPASAKVPGRAPDQVLDWDPDPVEQDSVPARDGRARLREQLGARNPADALRRSSKRDPIPPSD